MDDKKLDTLDKLLTGPNFGRLSRLTVLVILAVGIVITTATWLLQGGDLEAYVNSTYILGSFILAAISGGATTTFGKSETAYRVQRAREFESGQEYYGSDVSGVTPPMPEPNDVLSGVSPEPPADSESTPSLQNGINSGPTLDVEDVDGRMIPIALRITKEALDSGVSYESLNARYGYEPGTLEGLNNARPLAEGLVIKTR